MTGSDTLVLQSHNFQVLRGWIGQCADSTRRWAEARGYDYRFLGDEIFDLLPDALRLKLLGRMPIQADLARLLLLRDALEDGYRRAVWIDADVLIFAPDRLDLDSIPESQAFGRELWVEEDIAGRLKTWRNAHNAICLFRQGDPVLPFLIHTTECILARIDPDAIAPQIVGPKLLTALDTIAGFGRIDTVGAASPPVLRDIDQGGGPALDALHTAIAKDKLPPPAALNLCASLNSGVEAQARLDRVVARLLERGRV